MRPAAALEFLSAVEPRRGQQLDLVVTIGNFDRRKGTGLAEAVRVQRNSELVGDLQGKRSRRVSGRGAVSGVIDNDPEQVRVTWRNLPCRPDCSEAANRPRVSLSGAKPSRRRQAPWPFAPGPAQAQRSQRPSPRRSAPLERFYTTLASLIPIAITISALQRSVREAR